MTREEFATLTQGMKAVYAGENFIKDKDAFDVWYSLLQDIPYEVASAAVQKYMQTQKFPPTIADIREIATEITHEEEMTELETWSLVYKAICNSNYEAEAEFNKLPKACQIALGNSAALREMATLEMDTVGSVEQSHFIRNYRAAVKRMKEDRQLNPELRAKIGEMQPDRIEVKITAIEDKQEKKPETREIPDSRWVSERISELRKEFET